MDVAVSELRRVVLASGDTAAGHSRLVSAVADLARQLDMSSSEGTPAPVSTAETPVTEHVTESVAVADRPAEPASAATPAPAAACPDDRDTDTISAAPLTSSTIQTPGTPVVKTVDLTDTVGPGWTLVQHQGDADASLWRVRHHDRVIGTVRRSYDLSTNTRGWEARLANYHHVPPVGRFAASWRNDRLWRTSNSAAAGIALRASRISPDRGQGRSST